MKDIEELEIDAFLAQAESLAQLREHHGYAAYADLLLKMRTAALEELAVCKDAGEFRYWQGVVAALAEVLERPGRLVSEASAYRAAEEEDKKAIRPELRAVLGVTPSDDI